MPYKPETPILDGLPEEKAPAGYQPDERSDETMETTNLNTTKNEDVNHKPRTWKDCPEDFDEWVALNQDEDGPPLTEGDYLRVVFKDAKPKRALADSPASIELSGRSLMDFCEMKIDPTQNILGNRWLERTNVCIVVAPSGQGKSTMSIQASIEWSCGRTSFGIKPAKPLRILLIQAEDNDNDVISMAQIARYLELTGDEKKLVRQNTHLERVNSVSGPVFAKKVDGYCKAYNPDLVIINPLSSYLGGDDKDMDTVIVFRDALNRVLTENNCAAMIIAHTPKTNFGNTDDYKPSDWQYRVAGSAAITNWARSMLVRVRFGTT